jgi:hypothetical protein
LRLKLNSDSVAVYKRILFAFITDDMVPRKRQALLYTFL